MSLLDREFLAQLEYLYIVAKEGFATRVTAQRASKKFGAGLEYADHREYAAGDDFRYIDWQVFARLDRLVVKMFSEEQELSIYLLLDASLSMAQGEPDKGLFAKKLLAALGYIALCNLDRVVVVPFDRGIRPASSALTGRGRRMELLRFLENQQPKGETDIRRSMQEFVAHYKHRGMAIVASDFFDPSYPLALRMLRHNGFETITLQVNSRAEVDPPTKGDFELVDCESGERVSTRLLPRVQEIYREEWNKHYADLQRFGRVSGQGHFPTISDQPLEELLVGVLRRSGFLR